MGYHRGQVEAKCFLMTQTKEPEIMVVLHSEGGYKTCEALPLSEAKHLAIDLLSEVKKIERNSS